MTETDLRESLGQDTHPLEEYVFGSSLEKLRADTPARRDATIELWVGTAVRAEMDRQAGRKSTEEVDSVYRIARRIIEANLDEEKGFNKVCPVSMRSGRLILAIGP